MVFFDRFLEYAVTDGEVRKQDGTSVISSVGRNVIGRPIAWNFVRSRWNYIMKEYDICYHSGHKIKLLWMPMYCQWNF